LQLNVADRLAVDFRLELGQMTETISVTAEAPLVKTETGDLSYLVTTQQITELSINNRNFLSVQQLIPGASRTAADEQGIGLTGASIILVIASAGPLSFPGSTTGTGTRRSSSSRRSGAGAARPRSFAPPRRPKRCGTAISRPRRTGLGNPSSIRRRDKRSRTTGFQPAGSTKMRGFCWITFSLSLTPPAFSTSCRISRFRKTGARSS